MDLSFTYNLEAIIAIVIGVLFCLYGFKLKKLCIMLAWFIFGYFVAINVIDIFSINLDPSWSVSAPIIAGCVTGIAGYALVKAGFYLASGILAYIVVNNLALFDPKYNIIVGIVAAIAIGFLASKFLKPVIVIASTVGGASMICENLPAVVSGIPASSYTIIFVVIIVFGLLFQLSSKGS